MNNTKKIIYWHRFGFKVYNIDKKLSPILEKEIDSNDLEKIETELKYLSGQNILLLLADSISYLYEKTIDPPLIVDNHFKDKLLEMIKQDIPEDFSQFYWDFKIKDDLNGKQKVVIFAPIKEFQEIISQVSNKLAIKFDVIEPESIATTRDPSPIIGIYKKTDIKGKDEKILNLLLAPPEENSKKITKKILIFVFIFVLIFSIFLIIKFKKPIYENTTTSIITPSPTLITTPTPTLIPTPTLTIKEWSNLIMMVQNGTNQKGLAAKTASIFKTNGINQIEIGNADTTSYISNKLIFKDISLQEFYQDRFKKLIKIDDNNITVDNSITFDVIFITGTN